LAGLSTELKTPTGYGPHFAILHATNEKGFLLNFKFTIKAVPVRHAGELMYSSTILHLYTRWRWGVSVIFALLYITWERACGTHWIGGCMDPEPEWMAWRRGNLICARNLTLVTWPVVYVTRGYY
jgi:hypothetical protein